MAASAMPVPPIRSSAFPSSFQSNDKHLAPLSRASDTKPPESFGDMDWGNEDESFEVPKFHFDWGVTKDRSASDSEAHLKSRMATDSSPTVARLLSTKDRILSHHRAYSQTPPSNPSLSEPSSAASIVHSDKSMSSSHKASPSYGSDADLIGSAKSRQFYRAGDEQAGSNGNGTAGRSYGTRTFQRVVSAPVAGAQAISAHQYEVRHMTPLRRDAHF